MKPEIVPFCLLLAILTACSSPDAVLQQVFDDKEMVMVNQVIDYYDDYVWSKTDRSLPIEQAYRQFMNKNCLLAVNEEIWSFSPSKEERVRFFDTVDMKMLSGFYHVRDTFYLYSRQTKEVVQAVYCPYSFDLVADGKYLELLKFLSSRSKFYAAYYDATNGVGDISPNTYEVIFKSYPENNPEGIYLTYKADFDFSKKEERFVCIVPFLFINEQIEIPEGMYGRNVREINGEIIYPYYN
jgi:uncharacterized protein YfbU (UPF0304 family)